MTAKTVTALVVDDEPLARRRLRELIKETPWLECVGEASTGRAAVGAIDELHPDLVFLDVQLPGMSGIDVLARAAHRPAVIFTTAYDSYAVTAFELGAIDYLLKPFGRDRFGRALARARPALERQVGGVSMAHAQDLLGRGTLSRLFVRHADRIVPLAVRSIERIDACDDFVVVHAGGRSFRLNVTLADLEQRLDPATFVRVHRSHVVNMDHVTSLAPYDGSRFEIVLRSGARIVASRQRSRALRDMGRVTSGALLEG